MKKNKRPKYRYLLIYSLLNTLTLKKQVNALLVHKLSKKDIFLLQYTIQPQEKRFYTMRCIRESVLFLKMIINMLQQTKTLKTMHITHKYKQVVHYYSYKYQYNDFI